MIFILSKRVCLAPKLFVQTTPVCMKTSGRQEADNARKLDHKKKEPKTPRGEHFSLMFTLLAPFSLGLYLLGKALTCNTVRVLTLSSCYLWSEEKESLLLMMQHGV